MSTRYLEAVFRQYAERTEEWTTAVKVALTPLVDEGLVTFKAYQATNPTLVNVLIPLAVVLLISLYFLQGNGGKKDKSTTSSSLPTPPMVAYTIPFLGNAIEFGIDPIKFLMDARVKYGDCFTFLMMGRKMSFALGPDGNHFFFNIPIAKASAEGAYKKLTVPVFGTGVVYDVDNSVFMDQKKFVKDALTTTAFRSYVPMILEECRDFFKTWKDMDPKFEIFPQMAELTIRTASRCLMGKEIRAQLHSGVTKMYHDLDAGLAPINVFFEWLPLPTYFARDRANRELTALFLSIIKKRRASPDASSTDVLQSLMNGVYKNGDKMTDVAAAHMMIGLLMGGQHTSSTTLSWIIFEISRSRTVIAELLREQSMVLTGKPDTHPSLFPDFDYDDLKQFTALDNALKESLRLHSPIHTMMRKVETDVEYKGFRIPAGHFLCGSGSVSQLDPERFPDPHKYDPHRHENSEEGSGEWTINGVDVAQKSARSHFLPFGAGRHRCIGEAFAFVQIKSIISLFLREFDFDLLHARDPVSGEDSTVFPETDYTSLIVMPKSPAYISYARRPAASV